MPALNPNPYLLAAVNTRLGAPLVAQDRKRFKDIFGKMQQIDQNSAVKSLARFIAVRLVGR